MEHPRPRLRLGQLALWLAERYPSARVTGISDSGDAPRTSSGEGSQRGLTNVEIVGADAVRRRAVDRDLSIETFEHMRNWKGCCAASRRG